MRQNCNIKRWRIAYNMDDIATYKQDNVNMVSTESTRSGWGFFSEEISWFLCDFFTKRLNYELKLIFYSYYVTGMSLKDIGERFDCSHQAIHKKLLSINKMLSHAWQYSDRWREEE